MILHYALAPMPMLQLIERYIAAEVMALYDVYSYRHAAAILANSFPAELAEIEVALLAFRISTREIGMPGGNESDMPKKFPAAYAHWAGLNVGSREIYW